MKNINTKKLVIVSLLIGLNIVFSRIVSINAWNFKISLTFSTIFVAAYLYGLKYSVLVGGLGDLFGSLLFPIGAYNPLFTITAIASGFVFGSFCYREGHSFKKDVEAVLISQIACSLFLNTWFIAVTYKTSYLALLSTRVIQSLVMIVIQVLVIKALVPFLKRIEGSLDNE